MVALPSQHGLSRFNVPAWRLPNAHPINAHRLPTRIQDDHQTLPVHHVEHTTRGEGGDTTPARHLPLTPTGFPLK